MTHFREYIHDLNSGHAWTWGCTVFSLIGLAVALASVVFMMDDTLVAWWRGL